MSSRRQATSAVDCRACGWTGTVHLYWTATTELWVCPACLHADETTRSALVTHG